jgi:hypothetical protein
MLCKIELWFSCKSIYVLERQLYWIVQKYCRDVHFGKCVDIFLNRSLLVIIRNIIGSLVLLPVLWGTLYRMYPIWQTMMEINNKNNNNKNSNKEIKKCFEGVIVFVTKLSASKLFFNSYKT